MPALRKSRGKRRSREGRWEAPARSPAAVPSGRCPESAFSCGNGQCVTTVNPECDDKVDCSDGSDEARCGQSACVAGPGASPPPGSAAGRALWPARHSKAKPELSLDVGAADAPGVLPWPWLLRGLAVTSVLQTAGPGPAGGLRAGSWVAWQRLSASSPGKSASGRTASTSAGRRCWGPAGWCLRPTASASEPRPAPRPLPPHDPRPPTPPVLRVLGAHSELVFSSLCSFVGRI